MCDEIKELISLYIDGELDRADEEILMAHMEKCSDCQSYYHELKETVKCMNSIEQFELPENFHNEAMARIKNVSKPSVGKGFFIPFIKYASAAAGFAFLLTAFSVAGSFIIKPSDSSSTESIANLQQVLIFSEGYGDGNKTSEISSIAMEETKAVAEIDTVADMAGDQIFYMATDEAAISPHASSSQARLMLAPEAEEREASTLMSSFYYIEIQSEQFDMAMDIINELNASITNSGIYYGAGDSRTANFSMNISAADADTVIAIVRSLGEVVNESNYSSALKHQYDDASVRLSAKEQERLRLLSLMEKTKTMENLILLENRLSQIEAELDGLNASINSYVQTSDNSTLNLVINEKLQPVITYENKGFFQRVGDSFINSINLTGGFFEGLLVFVAASIIPLCIVAVLGGFGFMVYKLKKRREYKS